MAAHGRNARLEIGRPGHVLAQYRGDKEIAQDVPRGARGFVGVAGVAVGHAFAPTDQPVRSDFDQDALAVGDAAERGLERRNQRHAQVMEGDTVDDHAVGSLESDVWVST